MTSSKEYKKAEANFYIYLLFNTSANYNSRVCHPNSERRRGIFQTETPLKHECMYPSFCKITMLMETRYFLVNFFITNNIYLITDFNPFSYLSWRDITVNTHVIEMSVFI